jgi:DNA invertase Pin-like site-specific DNA recombinase
LSDWRSKTLTALFSLHQRDRAKISMSSRILQADGLFDVCQTLPPPGFAPQQKHTRAHHDGRPELGKLLNTVAQGDTVIITQLDRLARSTRDLLNVLAKIGEQGAGFRSLGDAWADTTTPHGRLMLTVLGGLAEFERELIRARTGEGRARAVPRGVKLGRSPKLTPHQKREALARRGAGETVTDIARTYNVHHSTISGLGP